MAKAEIKINLLGLDAVKKLLAQGRCDMCKHWERKHKKGSGICKLAPTGKKMFAPAGLVTDPAFCCNQIELKK